MRRWTAVFALAVVGAAGVSLAPRLYERHRARFLRQAEAMLDIDDRGGAVAAAGAPSP